MALTGKFCSLNQFFWGQFACGDKNMSPKSWFLNFTTYGGNFLGVIIYYVVLSMDGFIYIGNFSKYIKKMEIGDI